MDDKLVERVAALIYARMPHRKLVRAEEVPADEQAAWIENEPDEDGVRMALVSVSWGGLPADRRKPFLDAAKDILTEIDTLRAEQAAAAAQAAALVSLLAEYRQAWVVEGFPDSDGTRQVVRYVGAPDLLRRVDDALDSPPSAAKRLLGRLAALEWIATLARKVGPNPTPELLETLRQALDDLDT